MGKGTAATGASRVQVRRGLDTRPKHLDKTFIFSKVGSSDFEVLTSHTPKARHSRNTLEATKNKQ